MKEFNRDVWCLLGLPLDAVNMQETISIVQRAIADKSPCFISTPNLNFLILSQTDVSFRDSVINSELSIADGMPVLWVARLLGIPLPGRVPGSGLVESLRKSDTKNAINTFFFGGEQGVSEKACQVIEKEQSGLTCAGFYFPGFGSISDMSDPTIIETINASNPDFVVVSLGAQKGQSWIEQNRGNLSAPVICHLGAVVNFIAGRVRRAPVWMQKTGIEWVERILQEPKLWWRYFTDGVWFLSLLIRRVLPYAIWRIMNKSLLEPNHSVACDVNYQDDCIEITIHGKCVNQSIDPLRKIFRDESDKSLTIQLNLIDVPVVDGAFLGLCLVLRKHLNKNGYDLQFAGINQQVKRIFHWNCVEYLI